VVVVWGFVFLVVGGEVVVIVGVIVVIVGGGFFGLIFVVGIFVGLVVLGVSMYVFVWGIDGIKCDLFMFIGVNFYVFNFDYGVKFYILIKGFWVWFFYPYIYTVNDLVIDVEFKNKIID
jgi:hypothetical protein